MSDHTTALVPLETQSYFSPELRCRGINVDVGLFAEALIYYDCVIANITNQLQLSEFLKWFISQGRLDDFLALVRDGSVKLHEYSFATAALINERNGETSILNVEDSLLKEPNSFEKRYLYHSSIETLFPKARHRKHLYEALRGNVIEVKGDEYGSAIEETRKDYQNPQRNALMLQAFVDELYRFKRLGHPPNIVATVVKSMDGAKQHITWNIDFNELTKIAGDELDFHLHTPIVAGALSNRLILFTAQRSCDLYLPRPIGMLVGDKLYESVERVAKAGAVIEELKAKVEFPDIRTLVNDGKLGFKDILEIRTKARRFRDWLQKESERDRDAIIAYHNEIARETGLVTTGRKVLSIFGVIGGGAAGSFIGATLAGPLGAAVGGAAGGSIKYFTDFVSKFGNDWKPIVFGDWMRNRIETLVKGGNENRR